MTIYISREGIKGIRVPIRQNETLSGVYSELYLAITNFYDGRKLEFGISGLSEGRGSGEVLLPVFRNGRQSLEILMGYNVDEITDWKRRASGESKEDATYQQESFYVEFMADPPTSEERRRGIREREQFVNWWEANR